MSATGFIDLYPDPALTIDIIIASLVAFIAEVGPEVSMPIGDSTLLTGVSTIIFLDVELAYNVTKEITTIDNINRKATRMYIPS
jgi:hypothetical protein